MHLVSFSADSYLFQIFKLFFGFEFQNVPIIIVFTVDLSFVEAGYDCKVAVINSKILDLVALKLSLKDRFVKIVTFPRGR